MPDDPHPKAYEHPWKSKQWGMMGSRGIKRPTIATADADTAICDRPLNNPLSLRPSEPAPLPNYTELQVTSNYTFLTGGSHPDELVRQAATLSHRAACITDRNSLAGIVRAHVAAKEVGLPLVVGCRVETGGRDEHSEPKTTSSLRLSIASSFTPPLSLLTFPTTRAAYGRLCQLLTLGKRRAPKGACYLTLHDVLAHHEELLIVVVPPPVLDEHFIDTLLGLKRVFNGSSSVRDDRISIAVSRLYDEDDDRRLTQLAALSRHVDLPLVATNDVHYHVEQRRALQDVLTCIREGCTLDEAGFLLHANAERHLKSGEEMARLFAAYPEAIARTVDISERAITFTLDEIRYQYPDEICADGMTPMDYLKHLTWQGAAERFGGDTFSGRSQITVSETPESHNNTAICDRSLNAPAFLPPHILKQIEHEFELIEDLNYAPYFLTVYDLVVFARSQGIICQGRGAAANSAVCYCLGITSVDPTRVDLLFERFISRERNEPPDIDIDFEHERREEVIQYIYKKYGRHRAALTAEVISYRGRSAVREVGKAIGLSLDCVDRLAKNLDWWEHGVIHHDRIAELGLNPYDPTITRLLDLTQQIIGFPRHLSQHVGGFVITQGPLCELVPIENAAMDERTIIEWDKDDIDAMGMLKVDCLGLGMLTCVSKCFALVEEQRNKRRRDEETETRSNEAGITDTIHRADYRISKRKGQHGQRQDISGFDCVTESDEIDLADLSTNQNDAGRGTVRINQSNATSGRLNSIQHCRGVWTREPTGLTEIFENRTRFAERTDDAVRVGLQSDHALLANRHDRVDGGNRSCSPSSDQQPEEQITVTTSSLRHSVSPSLPPKLQLHTVPPEDPIVYDMICNADTIGVFQIESRAQMQMLPRLRPRCYYDLVIEVAIVRPGPIQGDMVHPYLRRRNGEEPVSYPNDAVKKVLGKTLGVPLFQEQAMALAIVAAGFTPGEADRLRRAIAAWKNKQKIIFTFGEKLINGMIANGYEREFAERCFNQIKGFSEYGFPESHAASFAHIVYVSAWLKCHHPAAFAAALINSQPMGFYAPAQIVRDAQDHGVEVRGVDVNFSAWDCELERRDEEPERQRATEFSGRSQIAVHGDDQAQGGTAIGETAIFDRPLNGKASCDPTLRLGMRLIKGMRRPEADAIVNAVRAHGPFRSIESLWRASSVRVTALRKLASADAFRSMGLDRQQALWQVRGLRDEVLPLFEREVGGQSETPVHGDDQARGETAIRGRPLNEAVSLHGVSLPTVSLLRQVVHDYATVGLSLKAHPMSFIRDTLEAQRVTTNGALQDETKWPNGKAIAVAGLVLVRQRPGTASGVVFVTLEDETGIANLIVRPRIFERYRKVARHATIMLARGHIERQGQVVHVMVRRVEDVSQRVTDLIASSRDFH